MPFFFTTYKGCPLATVLSFLGSAFMAIGVVLLVDLIFGKSNDMSGTEGILVTVFMFAFGAALSWLASVLGRRKARKRAEKAAREQASSWNNNGWN